MKDSKVASSSILFPIPGYFLSPSFHQKGKAGQAGM